MRLELSGTTGVKGVAGSVSAPSIVGDDTNTGISFPAADTIKFSTGGVERMSITNSGVTGPVLGITEFDQWYLSADQSSNGDVTSNLSRNNFTANASPLGTGMTESSGVFTFPSTGKWVVLVQCTFNLAGNDNVVLYTNVTTNNSSYSIINMIVDGQTGSSSENKHGGTMGLSFIDVTDTSQVKVKFEVGSISTGSNLHGRSDRVVTGFNFIRIGDT